MLTLLSLVFSYAMASENWFCTSEASRVDGNNIFACGVGEAPNEDQARSKAFESAKREFTQLCDASTSCKGRAVSVEPRRTTCEMVGRVMKCHRMLVFIVGKEMAKTVEARKEAKVRNYTLDDYWRDQNNLYMRPRNQ